MFPKEVAAEKKQEEVRTNHVKIWRMQSPRSRMNLRVLVKNKTPLKNKDWQFLAIIFSLHKVRCLAGSMYIYFFDKYL